MKVAGHHTVLGIALGTGAGTSWLAAGPSLGIRLLKRTKP